MARFDRYMLSQLMVLFGFFSLVLVLIYWINRAVALFDLLIADGQSAWVFLEFTALTLPSVIQLALPLAAFAAAVYVANRMTTESELVVVQATGYSPFRLARPVLYFGLIVTFMMLILVHFLVPASSARLAERQNDIAQNITARLLTEGQFNEPMRNVTFYIRELTKSGELLDIFLADYRDPEVQVTYTATKAYLLREGAATQLVMIDGLIQNLRTADQKLSTTTFEDFTYNISSMVTGNSQNRRRPEQLSTPELFFSTPEIRAEVRQSAARLLARGHNRFSQSILATVAPLLGFAALLIGGFSRFGVWKQIMVAILLIIVVKATETFGLNLARGDAKFWFATYVPSITGLLIVWALLLIANNPFLFARRIKGEATA